MAHRGPSIEHLEVKVLSGLDKLHKTTRAGSLPGAQTCSPIMDKGISAVHVEHLIVGRKLEARAVDAMIAGHFLANVEECEMGQRSMQLFVYVLRASRVET